MTKKPQNELKKRPYKRKYKCNNCKGYTDCPAIIGTKRYCQKCTLYRKLYKEFPSIEYIDSLKEEGLWKS